MGHSVARSSTSLEDSKKVQRRLELLPEEALYLVERGAMYCWSPTELPLPTAELLDVLGGVPMSVQQAYAEMVGAEDLTFEKYQVSGFRTATSYVFILDGLGICVPQTTGLRRNKSKTSFASLPYATSVSICRATL